MQLCFPLRHFRCRRSLCTPEEGQAADHFLTEILIDFSTVMSWIQNIIPIIPIMPALSP